MGYLGYQRDWTESSDFRRAEVYYLFDRAIGRAIQNDIEEDGLTGLEVLYQDTLCYSGVGELFGSLL
jgi:hypothetical protein